jgi:hypothetical protein
VLHLLKDTLQKITRALPGAASTSVTSTTAIDLGHGVNGNPMFRGELLISAPAVTTVMVPDTRTQTYDLISSANSDLSSPVTVVAGIILQTGAGGVGAAAATARYKPASDSKRYYGIKVTSGASTTDSSAVSATLELVF